MNKFQREFFVRLKKKNKNSSELVSLIGKLLHVGRDAVYRRMRGDTVLSADELMILARHFELSLSTRSSQKNRLSVMAYPSGLQGIDKAETYFTALHEHTRRIVGLPGVRVDFATPELPIYYEMSLPTLRSFKIFMYALTTWSSNSLDDKQFSPELISPKVHELVDELLADSFTLPGRELWSIGILDVTLRQISYLSQVGRFADRKLIDVIFEELHQLIGHLELLAKSGKRFPINEQPRRDSPDFEVYHNELSNTNSVILVTSDVENFVFSTLVNPNYLLGNDQRIVGDVQRWFQNLVTKGSPLSAQFTKYSAQYFDRLRQQVDETRERINFGNIIF